jgi:hypothetical protein
MVKDLDSDDPAVRLFRDRGSPPVDRRDVRLQVLRRRAQRVAGAEALAAWLDEGSRSTAKNDRHREAVARESSGSGDAAAEQAAPSKASGP